MTENNDFKKVVKEKPLFYNNNNIDCNNMTKNVENKIENYFEGGSIQ